MSAATSIEWTDTTWNPLIGCQKVSEGCRHCYAMVMASRIANAAQRALRDGKALTPRQEAYRQVVRWRDGGMDAASENDVAIREWNGRVVLDPEALLVPLRWDKPRRVFVNSMSDLFHEKVPDEWIDRVFAVMALAPQHTFQILTKRPERMRAYLDGVRRGARSRAFFAAAQSIAMPRGASKPDWRGWPLSNVWLGVSVESRDTLERIDALRATPAALRFLSVEPLLEDLGTVHLGGIAWVIVGGESGPGARPFDIAWARSVVAQCKAADVACFVKQLGARPRLDFYTDEARAILDVHDLAILNTRGEEHNERDGQPRPGDAFIPLPHRNRKGGDQAEWPEDLRVREFPEVRA